MTARLSLTVLGCDGSYPGPSGACSGYLVRSGGTVIWLDAGSGTLARLQEHVSLDEIDAVVISHSHPDHWTDIEGLAVAFRWVLKRNGPTVFAPEGIRGLMRVGGASRVLRWVPVEDGSKVKVGPISMSFHRTDHPVPTFAVRMEAGGSSLGYSADSGPAWSLSSLGPGLDLALCEATFLADKEGTVQHLSARQAGRTAQEAGVKRLVLTHLTPGVDREAARREAASEFHGELHVASSGVRFEV